MRDVIVVGAGPAGSAYARHAAALGADVLVFEQGQIGKPLACSGHVSTAVLDAVPASSSAKLVQNEIRGARFHLGGPDSRAYPFYADHVVSQVIDRVSFDQTLAESARAAGAIIEEEHTVTAVEERNEYVAVTVTGPDGVEHHRSRLLAGCDGPRSRVRQAVGLPDPDAFLHGILGFDPEPQAEEFVDVHLTVPGFFAWRIPRGEAGVEYGLGAPFDTSVSERFEQFCNSYGVALDRRRSGLIPIGPPETVTSDRTFLIGDAAAQTKPYTGGGIRYSLIAAEHAARTIDPADPDTLAAYERAWRGALEREIRLGNWVRRGYSLPTWLQRVGLWLFAGEIGVDIDRPSSLLSREQIRAMFSR